MNRAPFFDPQKGVPCKQYHSLSPHFRIARGRTARVPLTIRHSPEIESNILRVVHETQNSAPAISHVITAATHNRFTTYEYLQSLRRPADPPRARGAAATPNPIRLRVPCSTYTYRAVYRGARSPPYINTHMHLYICASRSRASKCPCDRRRSASARSTLPGCCSVTERFTVLQNVVPRCSLCVSTCARCDRPGRAECWL